MTLVLPACSLYPPKDGVEIDGRDGIKAVLHRFGVKPLDPEAPLLDRAMQRAAQTDPIGRLRGVTYNLTDGNRLPANWIVQTPDVWGRRSAAVAYLPLDCPGCDPDFSLPRCHADADCASGTCAPLKASVTRPGQSPEHFCLGHSDALVDRFYDLMVRAERAVDIALLAPAADRRFLAALRNAATRLAAGGHEVAVRIIIGTYPPLEVDAEAFARELTRDATRVPGGKVRLFVATTRSCNGSADCSAFSWNHAKLVAVDGRAALVGGHNMWTEDYLLDAPTHDLSMQVEGPAAADAHHFADALWQFVCSRPEDDKLNRALSIASGDPEPRRDCLSHIDLPSTTASRGGLRVLSVGRLANGPTEAFADQSRVVETLILSAARRSIRMVQQDIAFSMLNGVDLQWPKGAIDAIAQLIGERGGDAYLVLSEYGADGHVSDYSNKVTKETVVRHIRDKVGEHFGIAEPELTALVCERLHVAPLRFGPDQTWPDKHEIAVHTKMWMVDDRAFYIGSENLYPVELQEFGYVIEDAGAAKTLRQDFWDKAWTWSQQAAISGSEARACVLNAPVARR